MPLPQIQQILRAALAHHAQGRLAEAEKLYRDAQDRSPGDPGPLHLLGVVRAEQGQHLEATQLIESAIALRGDVARYHSDLGNVLCELGRASQAIACYERALELEPKSSAYYVNLGAAFRDTGASVRAINAYERALALDPCSAEAHNNLGVALADGGSVDDAITAFNQAIELNPAYADAHTNLGVTLYANGNGDEAVLHCRKAVELSPAFAKAHSNLALVLLGTGRFREGWTEHEWRWKCNPRFKPRDFSQPQWTGEAIVDKTILLHTEQGFGDAIQFARYIPLISRRAGQVILECQPALARLFQSLQGSAMVIPSGHPLPPFDTHCPLMSLPFALGEEAIPLEIPYLRPGSRLAQAWNQRIGFTRAKRVGLAWAGRPSHSNDSNRSMPPEHLSVLAGLPGIEWHSLQKHRCEGVASEFRPIDHSSELNDFADTAALIANLDLVISVDTAVAHLAGALGKRVWLMLAFASEWRWMLHRDDSPWYPTMRLFRQERWGDWPGVVRRVAIALQSEIYA